jgi:hypothetical protein
MSFSCTIKAGNKDLTKFEGGELHSQLFGLGPNGSYATEAPHRMVDFWGVIKDCLYGNRLPAAAQDCFRTLQSMAKENLESLSPEKHCETCSRNSERRQPTGWSVEAIETLLSIDASEITFVEGSW